MASPSIFTLSRFLKALRAVLIGVVAAVLLFLLVSWAGSSVPRNPGWVEPDHGVEVMVETNGVHTSLIVPLVNDIKDWRGDFPAEDLADTYAPYTHLSISWGEHEVFLNTPTWADLSPLTVLRIIGIGGKGVLHVNHYVRPAPSDTVRPIMLTRAQYSRLVASIERSVPTSPRIRHQGYNAQDVFYDTQGEYTVTNTCNQWTSDRLAAAGVKTGWWTPFAGGVMKWIARPTPQP